MKISLPTDCGNSPRMSIVGEFVVNWAKRNTVAIVAWLADDVSWAVVGERLRTGPNGSEMATPDFLTEHLEVLSIVTHGRLASCDGYLETGEKRVHFSHVLRFASVSKTAKISQIRSYIVTTD